MTILTYPLLLAQCLAFCLGDLIFTVAADTPMSQAVVQATAHTDSLQFSHVGIIDVDSLGAVWVIEATSEAGVVATPIDTFMRRSPAGAVVKRLTINYPADSAVARARACIGRPYDWWYLADNDALYCSELVEKCYLRADGSPIFETIPMSFRDASGTIPRFWTDLFNRLGRPIPEGEPGTNPTQLSHSPYLAPK